MNLKPLNSDECQPQTTFQAISLLHGRHVPKKRMAEHSRSSQQAETWEHSQASNGRFSVPSSGHCAPVRRATRSYQLRSGLVEGANCHENHNQRAPNGSQPYHGGARDVDLSRRSEATSEPVPSVRGPPWFWARCALRGESFGAPGRRNDVSGALGPLPVPVGAAPGALPLVSTRISHRPSDGDFPHQRNHNALVSRPGHST